MQARTPLINKHIFWLMMKPTLVIALGLLCLIWLMQSLRFLDLIINKGLSLGTFLHLTGLMIPFLLAIVVPLATLAGAIYAFKIMNDDNELPALFGAGLARGHILRPALWVGLLLMAFGYANALYLAPASATQFKKLQHEIRHSEGHLLLEEGTFNPLGSDIMLYMKNRVGRTGLNMLLVHDTRNPEVPVTWMAKHGNITFSPEGTPRLILIEGIRQEVTPTQTSMLAFEEHTLDIQRKISQTPPKRVKEARERFMHELVPTKTTALKYRQQFAAERMSRILSPITPIVLIFLAGAILLQPRATRRGVGRPVMAAAILGTGYIMLSVGLVSMSEGGNPLILYGQVALPFVMIALSFIFLNKGHRV